MRRLAYIAVLLALFPLSPQATVQKQSKVLDTNPGKLIPEPGASKLVLAAPFTSVGGGFLPDTNTVSNITWQSWTTQVDPSDAVAEGYNAIVWGNGKFVAVGTDSTSCTRAVSSDGITWTAHNCPAAPPTMVAASAIVWSGDKFVIVGQSGAQRIGYSFDGVTWSMIGNFLDSYLGIAVNSDATRYVIIGGTNSFMVSADGISWPTPPTVLALGSAIKAIAFGAGKFVIIGNSTFMTSPDGGGWSAAAAMPSAGYNTLYWDSANSLFIAAGNAGVGATSPDGTTWTARTLTGAQSTVSIARGSTTTLAVSAGAQTSYSSLDTTWNAGNSATATRKAVAWSPTLGMFAAVSTTAPKIETAPEVTATAAGGLADANANVWTQNGTVPQVTISPWYPNGFSAAAMPGAGPYSDANYYSLGTGSDVLDFAGDFSCCEVWNPNNGSLSGNPYVFDNGNVGAPGVGYASDPGTPSVTFFNYADNISLTTGNAPVAAGMNITCIGNSGTTSMIKMDLGALATRTYGSWTAATSVQARLGRGSVLAGRPWPGYLHARWCSTVTPSDALFTPIMSRLFGHVAATGQTFTVSRSATATAEPKESAVPSLYTYPVNILRITETGALIEAASANLALQSEALDTAITWVTTGTCAVTANAAIFADGNQTMELVKCSGAVTDTRNQAITVPSSTGPWTASVWMTGPAATPESLTLTVGAGVTTGCTCASSEPSVTCTVGGVGTATAFAYATPGVGPTVDRISLTCSSTLATTAITIGVHDGQYGTTFNVGGNFGGAQLEVAGYASSYIPTTTVAVTRGMDAVSVANPLPIGPFCVSGTWTPAPMSVWASATRHPWVFGAGGTANSARVQTTSGGDIVFQVIDGANGSKIWTVSGVLSGATAHTITACSDNLGTGTVTLDGVLQSPVVSGAGTGVLSTINAIHFDDGGVIPSIAAIKNFKVCKSAVPAACQ